MSQAPAFHEEPLNRTWRAVRVVRIDSLGQPLTRLCHPWSSTGTEWVLKVIAFANGPIREPLYDLAWCQWSAVADTPTNERSWPLALVARHGRGIAGLFRQDRCRSSSVGLGDSGVSEAPCSTPRPCQAAGSSKMLIAFLRATIHTRNLALTSVIEPASDLAHTPCLFRSTLFGRRHIARSRL